MTIDEIKRKRDEAEQAIAGILIELEQQTGCHIGGVVPERSGMVRGDGFQPIARVLIKLHIP